MKTSSSDSPFPVPADPLPDTRTVLNPILWFVDQDGYRVVFCRHEPIYRIALDDKPCLRLVAVMLRQSELATQEELAHAFGHSVAAQRRWERRYQQDGFTGLENEGSTGRRRKLDQSQEGFVRRWFEQGFTQAEIARRLGVGVATVNRTCKRLGLQRPPTPVPELPLDGAAPSAPMPEPTSAARLEPVSASAATARSSTETVTASATVTKSVTAPVPLPPVLSLTEAAPSTSLAACPATNPTSRQEEPEQLPATFTLDHDPSNRQGDRFLARQGLLADAVPLFAPVAHVPRAGALLAVPVLVGQGVLAIFQKAYGSLHPSFYGLRTLVLTLVFMALLRIKHPENLKEYAPADLGRLLGLDRAPEVKTVRRKLTDLADRQFGQPLLAALAQQRIAQQQEAVAFLYVDGHVREYHGQEPLAKTKKAQSRRGPDCRHRLLGQRRPRCAATGGYQSDERGPDASPATDPGGGEDPSPHRPASHGAFRSRRLQSAVVPSVDRQRF